MLYWILECNRKNLLNLINYLEKSGQRKNIWYNNIKNEKDGSEFKFFNKLDE